MVHVAFVKTRDRLAGVDRAVMAEDPHPSHCTEIWWFLIRAPLVVAMQTAQRVLWYRDSTDESFRHDRHPYP
jgi:hypothetical protein